ncbi:MAG: YncE family protein [Acidobacteriota bacterium]|nr:YncE family protein [Acidobacteriota bacterium]
MRTIPIPGDGFWDYMAFDPVSRHLFVSHATHVVVVDPASGRIVGDIPDTPGVHGIVFAHEFNRGFITAGQASKLVIFDLETLKVVGSAPTDKDCDGVVYDPVSKRVFTMNGDSHSSTVVDAKTGKVVGTIALGGGPEFPAADGKGHVYVNLETTSEELEIDAHTLKILHRWPMAPGKSPSGLAMDQAHRLLFAGCRNRMMAIINADTGKVVATPAIGPGVDACRFDPGTQDAFASNGGDGTLTVIHEDSPTSFHIVENVKTELGARTMALDPSTHEIFLATAKLERIAHPKPHTRPFRMVPGTFHILVYAK